MTTTEYLGEIDIERNRYPFCIVWTPIPFLTWFVPFIGHMGIATSSGVIRDFAGPYYVSEDDMAFGTPTKYWQLSPLLVDGGITGWDRSVSSASEIYKTRIHNLCWDNCHSHVGTALNFMNYNGSTRWNVIKLTLLFTLNAKYVSIRHYLRTWIPFYFIISLVCFMLLFSK